MDFVLGSGFTLLHDVVKEAMGGEILSYKPLKDLKSTLESLELHDVQQIGDLNQKLGLSSLEVEGLKRQMEKATELVPKLSSKLQTCNCILKCQYSNQLVKLDRSLTALVNKINIQSFRVQRETLFELRQNAEKFAEIQATVEQKLTVQLDLAKKNSETLAGMKDSFINLLDKMERPEEGVAEIFLNAKQNTQKLLKLEAIIKRQLNTEQVDQEASQVMDHTLVPTSKIIDLEVQQEPTEVAETLLPTRNITDQVVQQEPTEIAETLPTSNITDQEVQQEATEVAETLLPTSNTETELEGVQENALVQGAAVGDPFAGAAVGAPLLESPTGGQPAAGLSFAPFAGAADGDLFAAAPAAAGAPFAGAAVGDPFAGAAVGTLFTVLHEVVKDVKDKTMMFRELLGDLDSTLEALNPLIKDIKIYKMVSDQSNEEVENIMKQIADGKELVLKCSKFSPWTSFKKYKYAKQLLDLDKCLIRFLMILSVKGIRNGFENLDISRENLAVSKEALAV